MYVDECGDSGLQATSSRYFILSGMVLHEAYWTDTLTQVAKMRKDIELKYGFHRSRELHAGEMIGRASKKYNDIRRHERLLIFRDVLSFESTLNKVRVINVVVDKFGHQYGFDPFTIAWDTLINRFENTIEHGNFPNPHNDKKLSYIEKGLLIVDETDEVKLRKLIRNMRHGNVLPSSLFPGSTTRHDLKCIIEDPLHKQSEWSPLIQLCDANSYFLKQTIEPNSTIKKHGAKNYFYRIAPILLKEASKKDPNGIVWR